MAAAAQAGAARKRRRIAVVGTTDEYEQTCRLGEGSFGAVVMARHHLTGNTVAIKRLTAPGAARGELVWEACNLQDCSGIPFVVGFHGLIRDPATADVCLAMECVGPSLHAVLHGRPLPESKVRAVMYQLLTGAEKMHERHIIHRDIKTKNILVGDNHTVVKLCDFGIAMPMSASPPYDQAGTLAYMAPEMLLEKPDYDAVVDSWSLGCVMAELITGRVLFEGKEDEAGQLCAIFDVVGVPGARTWPWFSSTAFAAQVAVKKRSRLRGMFPEAKVSKEGYEVLKGLLTCNPGKRLTAAAALKQAWFANVDALDLARKEEVASVFANELPRAPRGAPKRRKLQRVV
ncbi:hypothetical protein ACP4OV_007662 [Aristida adscensionis]